MTIFRFQKSRFPDKFQTFSSQWKTEKPVNPIDNWPTEINTVHLWNLGTQQRIPYLCWQSYRPDNLKILNVQHKNPLEKSLRNPHNLHHLWKIAIILIPTCFHLTKNFAFKKTFFWNKMSWKNYEQQKYEMNGNEIRKVFPSVFLHSLKYFSFQCCSR